MVATFKEVVLALDWSPNTNHTGFYVAKVKGWYDAVGLKVHVRVRVVALDVRRISKYPSSLKVPMPDHNCRTDSM